MKVIARSITVLWAFCLLLPAGAAARQSEKTVAQWTRFEAQFTSAARTSSSKETDAGLHNAGGDDWALALKTK